MVAFLFRWAVGLGGYSGLFVYLHVEIEWGRGMRRVSGLIGGAE